MSCREIALLDPQSGSSWHEQMHPGQYAVHSSHTTGAVPTCTLCDTLPEAEEHARTQVAQQTSLRCRIYDHQGFVGAPLFELTGSTFKGERDLSPRVRRWTGFLMLGIGGILCAIDWSTGFRLSWPALVGSRLLIPGFILLVTEGLILLNAHQKTLEARKRKVTG